MVKLRQVSVALVVSGKFVRPRKTVIHYYVSCSLLQNAGIVLLQKQTRA